MNSTKQRCGAVDEAIQREKLYVSQNLSKCG